MSQYTEEHIFKYLDQSLSTQEMTDFEQELKRNPELLARVDQFRVAHEYLSNHTLESAPPQFSNQVMKEIRKTSKDPYFRPTGLFSNSGFLLVSGILTALIAMVSIIQGGYLDMSTFVPADAELTFIEQWSLDGLITKRTLTNTMMVIYGVLALVLLDRFVLNPIFKKKPKQLGFN